MLERIRLVEKENLLRVLIVNDSLDGSEALASLLRNGGFALRPNQVSSDAELQEAVKDQTLDLILCAIDALDPGLMHVFAALRKVERDIPVLAVADEYDPEIHAEVLRDGARDLVVTANPAHLQLAVARELDSLEVRRRLRQAEKTMRESEKRCRGLLDSSRDAITYVHDGMHIYANPVYLEMFGLHELEDLEGMPIMDMVAPDHHAEFKEFLRNFAKRQSPKDELDVVGLKADGGRFSARMEVTPASIEGEPCTQIIIRNQASDQELEKKLKYLSNQDLLTGLYNRQYFMDELEHVVTAAASEGSVGSVLYIEPDRFKDIKSKLGIAGSDLVLSDLAGVLRGMLGESCIAARFADQTFTVLCRETAGDIAEVLGDQIRSAVEAHISDVNGQSVTVTCSIGISTVGEVANDAQQVLSRAELACETARKQGGNRVHQHDPITEEKAGRERDEQWARRVRDALEKNEFWLVYQPIASLHGETQEKYEVLVRMRDEEGNEVLPGQFLPAAESANLIGAVDRWVMSRAIEVLAERRRGGHDTVFFIKLSAKSLDDPALLSWISEQLKSARLQGDSIVFELSEPAAITNLKQAKAFHSGLQELRCGLALEHFGSGVNSLQLLKHLTADYLKIDGSFMHNLANSSQNQEMVKSITETAHSLGKTTIAEYVEDASSLAVLWQCGVNYIQGHFLQSPGEEMNFDFQGEEA